MNLFILVILYLLPFILIGNFFGKNCTKIAKAKGHHESRYYWLGFFFLIFGFLPVIALVDLNAEKQRTEIITLLKDFRIKGDDEEPKRGQIITEGNKNDAQNTFLMKKGENYIIEGRTLKISNNTLKIAFNDNKNDVLEVRNYPTENIVDEVWVKIKVKYLFSINHSGDDIRVVNFIETVEHY